ncbi:hypothetical protein NQZ79_g309 [Umbelopsis isabellina]|nr:hypothetical protein NQZ79_g309 [Umbelopsis isabellina]
MRFQGSWSSTRHSMSKLKRLLTGEEEPLYFPGLPAVEEICLISGSNHHVNRHSSSDVLLPNSYGIDQLRKLMDTSLSGKGDAGWLLEKGCVASSAK